MTDIHEVHAPTWLDLYDYRQRVGAMYRERDTALRMGEDAAVVVQRFRLAKDALYAKHPQSALSSEDRQRFTGLPYFPYEPSLCVEAVLTPEPAETQGDDVLPASGPNTMRFPRAGRLDFTLAEQSLRLIVYWIDVYGGGLFLPFRDATSDNESYGGGRYLFDTVKGSDFLSLDADAPAATQADPMGYGGGRILLDFNYAYNPSCAYDPRWICPLAPNENQLPLPINAGERAWHL